MNTSQTNGVNSDRNWEEISIPCPWGLVAAKWWGPRDVQPILALHGWQDNAGTFDNLCPLLPADLPILCIDLPGHGKSSYYPKGMQYFLFWDGVLLLRRIVKHFNWKNVILLGHSLGGALSFLYAAAFPEEVSKFISIDMAGPTVRDPKKTSSMLGTCIDKFLSYENLPVTKMPCYNFNEMADLVVDAYDGSVTRESVKILMKRGTAVAPQYLNIKNGFHFTRDLRLKIAIMGMFSLEQVLSYAEQIKCEVLNIRGVPGMNFDNPDVYPQVINVMKKNCKKLVYEEVAGTHHLHLNNPESISGIITKFLLD